MIPPRPVGGLQPGSKTLDYNRVAPRKFIADVRLRSQSPNTRHNLSRNCVPMRRHRARLHRFRNNYESKEEIAVMKIREEMKPVQGDKTESHAPRKMTFTENLMLTVKVLAGFGLLGAALWGLNLWTAAR
jgi:hypothetical protein